MNSLLALLPDFAIVAAGALIGPRLSESSWRQIDGLTYHLLYPALLFAAASQRAIDISALLVIGVLACLIVSAGFVLGLAARPLSTDRAVNREGALQNAWRFNTALAFVAAGALPAEAMGTLAIAVGLAIPLANVYAVIALTQGQRLSTLTVAREVAFNPFLLASLAGVVVGISGQVVPGPVMAFVDRLADAAIPIVLLSLGAALRQARLWPPKRYALALHAIKLLVLPVLVWVAIRVTQAEGVVAATLLVFAALPTASAAHVLAARYGADRSYVALIVMQSTALGLLTLPFWTAVAARIAGVS